MSVEEWNALPWWQSEMYIEGLKKEGRLKDESAPVEEDRFPRAAPGTPSPPRTDPTVDYANDPLGSLPTGFKTRRAG